MGQGPSRRARPVGRRQSPLFRQAYTLLKISFPFPVCKSNVTLSCAGRVRRPSALRPQKGSRTRWSHGTFLLADTLREWKKSDAQRNGKRREVGLERGHFAHEAGKRHRGRPVTGAKLRRKKLKYSG